jgi:DNA-binding response OmpR family regulator
MKEEKQETICVLAVVAPKEAAAIEHIFSHTRWRLRIVHTIAEALELAKSRTVAVILCDRTLADGTWLDLMRETEHLALRPQTIVLCDRADTRFWAEVLNCGGYDLLSKPLKAREVYALIPAAWRHWRCEVEKNEDVPRLEQEMEHC